jgi:hypothetical protein
MEEFMTVSHTQAPALAQTPTNKMQLWLLGILAGLGCAIVGLIVLVA